ncbi:MAG: sigma-70 family RNA polymerase sigma factor [Myxococcales bacterium]|nr:sigma-70 family RNA polymerase sigma factor [Myxococcales bacterium]
MAAELVDDWTVFFAWRDGDERAAEQLATRYFAILMRFFLNKVRDVEDATELVSETFLGCAASKSRAARSRSFRSYLFAIAMNKLRGYYRTQAKRRRELEDFAEVCVADTLGRSPSSIIARAREVQLLVNALRRLTLAQQIVVELNYFEGMRAAEIAELLELPRSTVYTHLRRGRQRLESIITELASSPELAQSTVMGIETWAVEVRAKIKSAGR